MEVEVTRRRSEMELEKAKKLHSRIRKGIAQTAKCGALLRELVWEYDDGGWTAMGYASLHEAFKQDLRNTLACSKTTLYRMLKRGEVADRLKLTDNSNIDEGALDAFGKLEPEAQKSAFQSARLQAGSNPITAAIARKVSSFKEQVTGAAPKPKPRGGERVTVAERAFNLIRDVDHCVEEAKRLKAPGVGLLKDAASEIRPWANSHQEGTEVEP